MKTDRVCCLLMLLLCVSSLALAQNVDLFRYLNEKNVILPSKQASALATLRSRTSSREVFLITLGKPSDLSEVMSLSLDLPGNTGKTVEREYVTRTTVNDFIWKGVISDQQGSVLLTINGAKVTGKIHLGQAIYVIEPLGAGLHALVIVDESKFPLEHPPETKGSQGSRMREPRESLGQVGGMSSPQSYPVIDILVAHTSCCVGCGQH